ncbi:MAG: glycosyltransferase family 4 protein [Burkholderiales bacterium]|nr:glycosyltransferase family 4 protein [Burkholderiales bacterium]
MTVPAARLAILHTESSCGWGGQEIRILAEIEGMAARGHSLRLACPRDARIFEEARRRGIAVDALPIEKKRLPGAWAMRSWLSAHPADVINTHSSTDSWLAALACATLKGAPALVRTRHISAAVPKNAATRWLYQSATRTIVTTGNSLKEQLVRDNGFDAARIVSVPTGIDLTRFVPAASVDARRALRERLGLPAAPLLIGIVATLRSWKGHRYLIDALADLPEAHLVIVGDGPQRAALEERAAAARLSGRVTFAGNQADVVPWLQCLDVFALPSYANEGVPQAILQAGACALPMVTTDAGAIGEVARDGDTALIVAKEDAAALACAITRLTADATLARAIGERAAALVHARHGSAAMVDAMEAVFMQAAGR